MTLFRAATLLSLCLLLTPLDAAPYFTKSPSFRSGDRHDDPHGWAPAVINYVSHRTFTSQPMLSHVNRLFKNAPHDNTLRETLPNIAGRQGLVGDECSSDADCQGPRQCVTAEAGGAVSCTTESAFCICFSPIVTCSSEDECEPGELCVEVPQSASNLCVSADALANVNVTVEDTAPGVVSVGTEDSPLIDGLNGDSCSSDSDCTGSRVCLTLLGTEAIQCSGQQGCVCIAENPTCSSNSDCESGEFCQSLGEESSVGICLSTSLVPNNPAAQAANEEATATSLDDDEPTSIDDVDTIPTTADGPAPNEKLNFEICQSTDECAGTRICQPLGPEDADCSTTECRCVPSDPSPCTSADDCEDGESCVPLATNAVCVSDKVPMDVEQDSSMETEEPELTAEPDFATDVPEFTDEPTPTDDVLDLLGSENPFVVDTSPTPEADECQENSDCADGEFCQEIDGRQVCEPVSDGVEEVSVCISTHHLSHMSQEELIYASHRVARVLCDESHSCATPGHMIKYKGTTMMMSSYCEMMGCTSKIDTVNSPRYYPGKLIESNSDGLEFTAHAARYNTRLEERMLRIAVRVGL